MDDFSGEPHLESGDGVARSKLISQTLKAAEL